MQQSSRRPISWSRIWHWRIWGRKEIKIAETEMPGLMAIRHEFAAELPLRGARINRLLAHDHPNGGADRNPERPGRAGELGVCNIYSTQDHDGRGHCRERHTGIRGQGRVACRGIGLTRTAYSSGREAAIRNA